MSDDKLRFTFRVSKDVWAKFAYIIEKDGVNKNKGIEVLVKRHIARFEEKYGPIAYEDMAEWAREEGIVKKQR